VIVALPTGELANVFTQIDRSATGLLSASLRLIRSPDRGETWSAPQQIVDLLPVGASDPDTGQPIRDGSILASVAVDPAGGIHVAWQDARFSGGARDGIAYARSSDTGVTWSTPMPIHGDPAVQAFLPTIHIRNDGMIGVAYFDLRSNTIGASLPTDFWIATSSDGENWVETRIAETFDLAIAPVAGGLFIGDYMGLGSVDRTFLILHATTKGSDATNRSDIHLSAVETAGSAASRAQPTARAVPAYDKPAVTEQWRWQTSQWLQRSLRQRLVN